MKTFAKLAIPALMGAMLVLPAAVQAQRPGGTHRGSTETSRAARTTQSRPGGTTRPGSAGSTARPAASSVRSAKLKPGTNAAAPTKAVTPQASRSQRPAATRPGNGNTRPGNNRPGNSAVNNRPNQGGNHGNANRPGNNRPGSGAVGNRPDQGGGHNHGGNVNRPGNNRPAHGGLRPGFGGNSVHRPGGWASASRPHYDYRRPSYRPPRPGGGYWGAPRPNPYRINYWVPPVPRYVRVLPSVPTIGTVLGLTFGSFIDAGINALYNAGYSINGYYNNAIYLNNVLQFGYTWPEVVVQYDDGLMSGTQFYNWTPSADQSMYYNLYNQLTGRYGMPVETSYSNGGLTSTWWAGGNTGYITLSYGYGPSATGLNNYYTSLTYTAY